MFAELCITSNFSFLKGAAHPEEYMRRAALFGMPAIAIADENSVAGIVRAHTEARDIARRVKDRADWEADHSPIGPPWPWPTAASPLLSATPRLLPAAKLIFTEGLEIATLAQSRAGWARLSLKAHPMALLRDKLAADLGETLPGTPLHAPNLSKISFTNGNPD